METMPTAADLFVAVSHNDRMAVERMVKSGMNLNVTVKGTTPLSLAIYRNYADLVEMLVEGGADVNVKSKDHMDRIEPPLCTACRLGKINILNILLRSPNVNINQTDFFNQTPLWLATKERRCDLVKLLLDSDASVNTAEIWSECPLYLATKHRGRGSIAELLIRNGCRVNNADSEGHSPLYWTVQKSNRRIFNMLICAGAKVKPSPWLAKSELPNSWQTDLVFCSWIEELQRNPATLKFLARNFIRRWLSLLWNRLKVKVVKQLPIPETLHDFLLLNDCDF